MINKIIIIAFCLFVGSYIGSYTGLGNKFYRALDPAGGELLTKSMSQITDKLKKDETEPLAVIIITQKAIYQARRINENHDLIIVLFNKKTGNVLTHYNLDYLIPNDLKRR